MTDSDKKPDANQNPTVGTGQGQIPAEGIAPTGRSTLRIVRDGIFKSAKRTLEFLDQSEKDKTVKVRVDDSRAMLFLGLGIVLVSIFCLMPVLSPAIPFHPALYPVFIGIGLIGDLLLGVAVLWYVALRFGILRSLDPRYAILTFQLLLGTGILFTYLAVNTVVFFLTCVKWGPH